MEYRLKESDGLRPGEPAGTVIARPVEIGSGGAGMSVTVRGGDGQRVRATGEMSSASRALRVTKGGSVGATLPRRSVKRMQRPDEPDSLRIAERARPRRAGPAVFRSTRMDAPCQSPVVRRRPSGSPPRERWAVMPIVRVATNGGISTRTAIVVAVEGRFQSEEAS